MVTLVSTVPGDTGTCQARLLQGDCQLYMLPLYLRLHRHCDLPPTTCLLKKFERTFSPMIQTVTKQSRHTTQCGKQVLKSRYILTYTHRLLGIQTFLHTHTYIHLYTHKHTLIYTHTYSHKLTYTHTYRNRRVSIKLQRDG